MASVRLVAVDPSARGARGAAVDGMVGKCVHWVPKSEWWAIRDETGNRFKLANIQTRGMASTEGVFELLM